MNLAVGTNTLTYTPANTVETLQITRSLPGVTVPPIATAINISGVVIDSITIEPQLVTTTVCSEDKYEYGYNGQMKVNEIAGVGNHYTSLYGEFDPRRAGRWNRDPKPNASLSDYSIFRNKTKNITSFKGQSIFR